MIRLVAVSLLFGACDTKQTHKPATPNSQNSANDVAPAATADRPDTRISGPLEFHFVAEPKRLSMAELENFEIGLQVTNRSGAVVDIHKDGRIMMGELYVNGEVEDLWTIASSNGALDLDWNELKPSKTFTHKRNLGRLFSRPGAYHLVMKLPDDLELATDVTVSP